MIARRIPRRFAVVVTLALASCGDNTMGTDGPAPVDDLGGTTPIDQAMPGGDLSTGGGDLPMTSGDLAGTPPADLAGTSGDDGAIEMPDLVAGPDIARPPCNAQTCPNGCCFGLGVCIQPSVASCGMRGDVCQPCDPMLADGCERGACSCGLGLACQPGQVCDGGSCVCNAQSCPNGCCDGNVCLMPSLQACGTGGQICTPCGRQADACINGECRCGNNMACAQGQACSGGGCVCNINSCPDGCCAGAACTKPVLANCGAPGTQCSPCDPSVADNCATGTCSCGGNGRPCGAGQQCVNGACACTATPPHSTCRSRSRTGRARRSS